MKQYAIHGKPKGKYMFEAEPVVQVRANSPEEAEAMGRDIIKNHPIYNEHFADDGVEARENGEGE